MTNATVSNIQIARSFSMLLLLAFAFGVLLAGCAPVTDKTTVPKSVVNPGDGDFAGASDESVQVGAAMSQTRTLNQIRFGGAAIRTTSSSPSFKMVSGVGVQ